MNRILSLQKLQGVKSVGVISPKSCTSSYIGCC
jgi:hypothetical protein